MDRLIEELSLNAWPALQTLLYDGWLLRFANGYTRRANSVNAIYSSSLPTVEKIRYCEEIYKARNLDCVFKITPFVCPDDLDSVLAENGYEYDAETSVQTCLLGDIPALASTADVLLQDQPSEDWIADYCRLSNRDSAIASTAMQMLRSIAAETCYIRLRQGTATVSLGLGVVDRGYLGVYDIVTDAAIRNQGLGRQLISQLWAWGKSCGATHAYLQVMLNNPPALRLYQRFGYQEIYRYWYRVKKREGL